MSQNYKIVGMLERIDEQSMDLAPATTYATTQEAASLIQELGEALSEARAYLSDTISAHHPIDDPAEIALLARFDAILSKLNEA